MIHKLKNGLWFGLIGWMGLIRLAASGAEVRASLEEEADEIVTWGAPEFPEAAQLLTEVRTAFPREQLQVQAQLLSKSRAGVVERELQAEMSLDWRGDVKAARYIIRDAFGSDLEQLNIRLRSDQPPETEYSQGSPAQPAEPPAGDDSVQDTDVTWQDLTLAFLWWPGGQTVDAEKVKGRFCYVVDLPVPPAQRSKITRVRLWIDPKAHMLLKAEQVGSDETPLRRLEVKSFKRINRIWMVKDLEVVSFPSRHHTAIRVSSVNLVSDRPEDQPVPAGPHPAPARKSKETQASGG